MADNSGKSLKSRLIMLVLLVSIIPITLIGYLSYMSGKNALRNRMLDSLTAIAESRETAIILYLKAKAGRTIDFASDGFIRNSCAISENPELSVEDDSEDVLLRLNRYLVKDKMSLDREIYGINVIDLNGTVIASTMDSEIGLDESKSDHFLKTLNLNYGNAYISDISINDHFAKNIPAFSASAPLMDKSTGDKLGVIVNYYKTTTLNVITTDRVGMGESGEVYIVNKDGYMITDSRFTENVAFKQRAETKPVKLFLKQREIMTGFYLDYRGKQIVGASTGDQIDKEFGLCWVILAEIDKDEAFAPVTFIAKLIGIMTTIVAAIVAFVGWFFGTKISKPINLATTNISGTTKQISTTLNQHERTSTEQAVSVNETNTTIEEIDLSIKQIAEQSETAAGVSNDAMEMIDKGGKSVDEALEGINNLNKKVGDIATQIIHLSKQTGQIENIINLVSELANQTNLLALNAAVEAARAGEHGRGFAVVSTEIRKLADESKKSAGRIRNIVAEIQKATDSTVMVAEEGSKTVEIVTGLAQKSSEAFSSLASLTKDISENAQQISLNVKQQSQGLSQITKAMVEINASAKENVAGFAQTKEAVKFLDEAALNLKNMS